MGNLESKMENPITGSPSLELPSSILPRSSIFGIRRRWVWVVALLLILAAIGVYALTPWQWFAKSPEESGEFHWQEAQRAIADRDLPVAKTHLQYCLEKWPFNPEVHFVLARTCRRDRDYPRWRVHLVDAKILGWPRKEIELEQRLWQAQTGDIWHVEKDLLDYLQTLPPEAVFILEALTEGYMANNRDRTIMELTDSWIQQFPDDWVPHLYRAHVYYKEGFRPEAIPEYEKVLAMAPDQSLARLGLAEVLMIEGRLQEAFDHFQIFLGDNPGDPEGLTGQANCLLSLGKTPEAKEVLDQLLAAYPDDVKALAVRAKVALAIETPAEALKWLRRAEALAPSETDISHNLVVVLGLLGQTQEAEKYQRQREGILKMHAEMIKLRKQVSEDPQNVSLRYQIGEVNRQLGRLEDAAHWYQTALWIDPRHEPSQKGLEQVLKMQESSPSKPGRRPPNQGLRGLKLEPGSE